VSFLVVKWIHVLSATLLLGTGLGIAFFLWIAHLRGDPRVIAATARTVVIADALFTAPAVVLQLATGLWLAKAFGWPLDQFWLKASLVLYAVVVACWLPVLWLQVRARDLAAEAAASGSALPPAYHRAMRAWFWLGWPAFASVLAIFWLMIAKPT
jgi:uncharacterized membrane protein